MRLGRLFSILMVCCVLSACASVLIGNKAQSMLLKALFKPLVGFDPTEVKILENPLIKDRMVALLGDKYEPTMKLLNTAQEIRQEGALFYIASRYAPSQVQAVTDKAGLIWNSNTNQMAVMLINDGAPQVFSEQIAGAKEKILPTLPSELQTAYDKATAAQKALEDQREALKHKLEETRDSAIDKSTRVLGEQLGVSDEASSAVSELAKGKSAERMLGAKLDETLDQEAKQAGEKVKSSAIKSSRLPDDEEEALQRALEKELSPSDGKAINQ